MKSVVMWLNLTQHEELTHLDMTVSRSILKEIPILANQRILEMAKRFILPFL